MSDVDLSALDRVQGRRFMVRFDLPNQEKTKWSGPEVESLMKCALGKWAYIGQCEQGGKNGRLHVQAYVESPTASPVRVGSIVRAIRKHTDVNDHRVSVYVKRAMNSAGRCVAYCSKNDTRVWGPWSNRPMDSWPDVEVSPGASVTRSDLYNAVMSDGLSMSDILADSDMAVTASTCLRWLADLIRQREAALWGVNGKNRDVQTLYIYGASNTGKSQLAREYLSSEVGQYGFFVVSDYKRDPWEGYACQRGVLMDDLRMPTPTISSDDFLRLLDRYPLQLSRRYANSWAAFDRVVITSNWSPAKQWEALKWGGSLSAQPTDEDRAAFMRRLTRIVEVGVDGSLTDRTMEFHGGVDQRGHASGDELRNLLASPPPDVDVMSALRVVSDKKGGVDIQAELGF